MDHEMPDAPDPNTDSQDAVKEEKTVPIKDEALENMFDDDDDEGEDEDEYSSSAKTKREPSPQAASYVDQTRSSTKHLLTSPDTTSPASRPIPRYFAHFISASFHFDITFNG